MECARTLCRAVALLTLCLAGPAFADVLASKAVSTAEFGWNSNISGTEQQAADDLTLANAGVANQLTWFGFRHDGGPSANFRVRIFADAGAEPAAIPFYDQSLGLLNGTPTGLFNQFGNSILRYSSAIPPVALNAGTEYWLMIASSDPPIWAWSHAVVGPAGNDQFHRNGDGGAWRSLLGLGFPPQTLEQAFTLEGVIPEPGSLAAVLVGLGVLSARRR
jgi:hypothetical protein